MDMATASPAAASAIGPPPTLLTPLETGASPLTAILRRAGDAGEGSQAGEGWSRALFAVTGPRTAGPRRTQANNRGQGEGRLARMPGTGPGRLVCSFKSATAATTTHVAIFTASFALLLPLPRSVLWPVACLPMHALNAKKLYPSFTSDSYGKEIAAVYPLAFNPITFQKPTCQCKPAWSHRCPCAAAASPRQRSSTRGPAGSGGCPTAAGAPRTRRLPCRRALATGGSRQGGRRQP